MPFRPHLHKTGDIGRWRPDGSLETLRRVDDQVKAKVSLNFDDLSWSGTEKGASSRGRRRIRIGCVGSRCVSGCGIVD